MGLGLQRRPPAIFTVPQEVRVLVESQAGCPRTHLRGSPASDPTHARFGCWEKLQGRTGAVVDRRTSSQPRGLGGKDKRDLTPSRPRGPRPTPALRLHLPAPAIAAPQSCERVPPSGLVAGTGASQARLLPVGPGLIWESCAQLTRGAAAASGPAPAHS